VLLRLAYLSVTNVFALVRLLPVSDRHKDMEILADRLQRRCETARWRIRSWASRIPSSGYASPRLLVRAGEPPHHGVLAESGRRVRG
jgi:hypothetical protein